MSMSSKASHSSTASSSSSDGTGSFSASSEASFSSQSTVIAARPNIQPFGKPEYNYFWIENKSKSNPQQSYYYNCKSHEVVWNRPVPKNVSLPCYMSGWSCHEEQNVSGDEEILNVSDEEDAITKRKRLKIKKRNRLLVLEDRDDCVQIISMNKTLKSKKSLEVFWKLYRFPGESIADVKKRLLNVSEDEVELRIKKEKIANGDCTTQNPMDISGIKIKKEIMSDDDNSLTILREKISKDMNDDSDSDPDGVSALIKQENMMNYEFEDSELEDENQDKNKNSEEESVESESESEGDLEKDDFNINSKNYGLRPTKHNSLINLENTSDSDYAIEDDEYDKNNECGFEIESDKDDESNEENYIPLDNFCNIEIIEDYQNAPIQLDNSYNHDEEHDINWAFEKTAEQLMVDSPLTRLALNPFYKNSELKRKKKQKKRQSKIQKKMMANIIVKQEPEQNNDGPIICDMYGTRTINYNGPDAVKMPEWQVHSRLSDSSDDSSRDSEIEDVPTVPLNDTDMEVSTPIIENTNDVINNNGKSVLELKNWFPKKKRTRKNSNKSDSSWCASDISNTNLNDAHSDSKIANNFIQTKFIKKEKTETNQQYIPPNSNLISSESNLDLSRVKIEKPSSPESNNNDTDTDTIKNSNLTESEEMVTKPEKKVGEEPYSSDSESSSSSCCSKTSCSCSSSSSDEEDNKKEDDQIYSKNNEKTAGIDNESIYAKVSENYDTNNPTKTNENTKAVGNEITYARIEKNTNVSDNEITTVMNDKTNPAVNENSPSNIYEEAIATINENIPTKISENIPVKIAEKTDCIISENIPVKTDDENIGAADKKIPAKINEDPVITINKNPFALLFQDIGTLNDNNCIKTFENADAIVHENIKDTIEKNIN